MRGLEASMREGIRCQVSGVRDQPVSLFCPAFEGCVDGHGVAVAEAVIFLQPVHNFHRLDAGLEQALLLCQRAEVVGRLAGLGVDVVDVGFEGHGRWRDQE